MSLEFIYVTRHGFRSNWVVDPKSGEYSTSIPSPTGIPSDPALAGYGVAQSQELAEHLSKLQPPIQRFYSSPFYRCIQTISPAVTLVSKSAHDAQSSLIRGENGVGEWYGMARFDHPSPADPPLLRSLFQDYDIEYEPAIKPSVNGETIEELHDRAAYALHRIIEQSDKEGVKAICICTHAATLIAMGRVLTGRMPKDVGEEDFRPFTCGVSTFVRRKGENVGAKVELEQWKGPETEIPKIRWRNGSGVGGGWDCTVSGDCSFLSGGEERGWKFSGDESFIAKAGGAPQLDAGSGLGTVVEGKKKIGAPVSPSRL